MKIRDELVYLQDYLRTSISDRDNIQFVLGRIYEQVQIILDKMDGVQ